MSGLLSSSSNKSSPASATSSSFVDVTGNAYMTSSAQNLHKQNVAANRVPQKAGRRFVWLKSCVISLFCVQFKFIPILKEFREKNKLLFLIHLAWRIYQINRVKRFCCWLFIMRWVGFLSSRLSFRACTPN